MNQDLTTSSSIIIDATPAVVWDTLINPEKIKQYYYGTTVETDWKVGSPIRFTGEWDGKPYVDKGAVVAVDPQRKLQYAHLSSFNGLPDQPENYSLVTFDLDTNGEQTRLTVSQRNFQDEAQRDHYRANWEHFLAVLKDFVESESPPPAAPEPPTPPVPTAPTPPAPIPAA